MMRLSELIKAAQKAIGEHGDMDVTLEVDALGYDDTCTYRASAETSEVVAGSKRDRFVLTGFGW